MNSNIKTLDTNINKIQQGTNQGIYEPTTLEMEAYTI